MNFGNEPGWFGAFTRAQAPQAKFKNGTRVSKGEGEPGDMTPKGTGGLVLGSIHHELVGTGYFVEWDNRPKVAAFVVEAKLR